MCFCLAGFIKSKNGEGGRIQTLPGVKKYTQLTASLFDRNVDTPPPSCFCGKSEEKGLQDFPLK